MAPHAMEAELVGGPMHGEHRAVTSPTLIIVERERFKVASKSSAVAATPVVIRRGEYKWISARPNGVLIFQWKGWL